MGNKQDSETIPIGVNFFDPSKSIANRFIDQRGQLQTKTIPTSNSASYRITNIMPYDSAYTFSVSDITTSGNTTGIGLDENGYYRVFIESTTESGIKSIITNYEQSTGIKIVSVRFTYDHFRSPVWKRIS